MTDTIDAAGIVAALVKPLVWGPPLAGFYSAPTGFGGKIEIMWDQSPADGISYVLHPGTPDRQRFPTIAAAQAAAEADYRARIAAALDVGPILALVGAAKIAKVQLEMQSQVWADDLGRALAAFKEASHG